MERKKERKRGRRRQTAKKERHDKGKADSKEK